MNMKLLNLSNLEYIIDDVIVHPLKVFRDERGLLVESLKSSWEEVYSNHRPFSQNYYSITEPGQARDKDTWHVHEFQEDRFVVIAGDIVIALYDNRPDKRSYKTLNLFKMGETNGDDGQYLLLIPAKVLHGFCVVGKKNAIITNFPTRLYNPDDEGRIKHSEISVEFHDGTPFTWEKIIKELK